MEQTRYSWASYEYHRASKRRERERQARLSSLQETLTTAWAAQQWNGPSAAARPHSPAGLPGRGAAAVLSLLVYVQVRALGVVVRLCLR